MRLVNGYMTTTGLIPKVALTVAAAVAVALVLKLCIDQPIEKLRARVRDRSKEGPAPPTPILADMPARP